MSDTQHFYSLNINLLQEPTLQQVCELLDQTGDRGWRRLAGHIARSTRFRFSSLELQQCSLKVMEPEGSPARSLLRLMGDQGCTTRELTDFLQSIGLSDAIQILKPPGIKVTVQPQSVAVQSGQMVRLSCVATGHPIVNYQWFKMDKEVPHGNSSELAFNMVDVSNAGFYICRVNNSHSFDFSNWAQLEVIESNLACHGLSDDKLQIRNQPQPQKLLVGSRLVLECSAVGRPLPRYQWFRNGVAVVNCTNRVYEVSSVSVEDQGLYFCRVCNGSETEDSIQVEVVVDELSDLITSVSVEEPLFEHHDFERITTGSEGKSKVRLWPEFYLKGKSNFMLAATDKVALLIGNMSYKNHLQLKAPMVDVYELTNLLRQLDFKVVSLLDLTEVEMKNAVNEFMLLLDKGVYALFYYAGHGFENFGNSFMVPIDAPNPYRSSNCLCVQNILKRMQDKETALNVFLLDMCRKRNRFDDTILIPENLKVTANIVFGYATCQGAEAFEIQHSNLANGIFMKFLKKRLLEDMKVTVLLDQVAEDMWNCHVIRGVQALEICSSLSARRALTDPIRQQACSPEPHLQWAKANELPESMSIQFDCGVEIKLGFAAEFSNVMIIYTRIISQPKNIIDCKSSVTDFPLDLYVDPKETNKGTPEETGSLLMSKELPKHCLYTRLSSLQTLKKALTFTVVLTYTYEGMEDMVEERRKIDVGKPLVAKLDIPPGLPSYCTQTSHIPLSPCHSPERASVSAVAESPHLFPSPHYSPSPFCVYHPNLRSSEPQESYRQDLYSSYPPSSGRRYFSDSKSLFSMPSQRNIPEESSEDTYDFTYHYKDLKK
ncbi:mucosa-associated lymphoid tissue lymphoma translocation protein 1 [Gastrophryne carolinensis]